MVKNNVKKSLLGIAITLFFAGHAYAQQPSKVTEELVSKTTYPFSDPDPIASNQKLYPYFRFDGFSNTPIQKKWNVVNLENDYIKVQIMPEIGGKIWTAYDKVNKRDYLYNNDVVKFRDIAMRGPWTSGGIEANYGVIGHTPNTSTAVDYLIRTNADGSASCIIHTLDLLSRTRWTLEIRLEKDKGYFTTKSFWSNSNPIEQPYYTWMNLGIPAGNDLQFVYPGHKYIGHGGEQHNWPIDSEGRDLSTYTGNAFGDSKSYHVLGAASNTFGAYWSDSDYGMARYANREDKLGKKIFLWAQSGSGQIWEDLLTDNSGQYVEIQSGRLFNQNMGTSSETPFKQIGFQPYQTDRWEENWLPYHGIGKATAINLVGAFKLSQNGQNLEILIDPKQSFNDSLIVYNADYKRIGATQVSAKIGTPVKVNLDLKNDEEIHSIVVHGNRLDLEQDKYELKRPVEIKVKLNEVDSLAFLGRDLLRFRLYSQAEPLIRKGYDHDPNNTSILSSMIKLSWFRMEYEKALEYASRALELDTYNAEANYYYGLINEKLGREYDARDGYQVASMDAAWRASAFTALSRLHFKVKDYAEAISYAEKALKMGAENIEALQIQHLAGKILKNESAIKSSQLTLESIDPLNPFLNFENLWLNKTVEAEEQFLSSVKQELRTEAFLELAIWYYSMQLQDRAAKVLEVSPQNTETLYWLAWLNRSNNSGKNWLNKAEQSSPEYVFPFREESQPVFEWASQSNKNWRSDYLQALLYRYRNQSEKALSLLSKNTSGSIDFAPYFAVRSELESKTNPRESIEDLILASKLDPKEWRYGKLLSNQYRIQKDYKKALEIASKYFKADPKNYILGMNYSRMLLLNKNYQEADNILSKIHILPFEGATDGHRYYEQAKLMMAYDALIKNNSKLAKQKIDESRLWPKELGVGEPYQDEKQEFLADWLEAQLYKNEDATKFKELLKKISDSKSGRSVAYVLLKAEANDVLGNQELANKERSDLLARSPEFASQLSALQVEIKNGKIQDYWPKLIAMVYNQEDQRIF